jgi:hypothetical protein
MEKLVSDEKSAEPILEDQLGLDNEPGQTDQPVQANTTAELTDGMAKKKTDLRPWYKRPKTWIIAVLATLVLLGAGAAFLMWRNRTTAQEYMLSNWRRLISAAELVNTEAQQASYTSFGDVEKSLLDMQNLLGETETEIGKLPDLLGDKQSKNEYSKVVDQLKTYVGQTKDQIAELDQLDESDLDSLESTGTATKLALEETKRKLSFLKDSFPNEFFVLNERIATVIEAYQTAQDEEKAKQDAEKSEADQIIQDKANAEEAVSLWTQAYIAGNVDEMRKYMTAAFAAEYDFSQVTSTSRQYNYPTTYRRVNTDKRGDQYEIIETVTYITKSDYSADTTYTQTFALLVSQDPSSKQWAVNSLRYQ